MVYIKKNLGREKKKVHSRWLVLEEKTALCRVNGIPEWDQHYSSYKAEQCREASRECILYLLDPYIGGDRETSA